MIDYSQLPVAAAPTNPLTTAHCRTIDEVLASIPALKATIEAFERCGMDCAAQKDALLGQYNVCTAIKREFNPLAP